METVLLSCPKCNSPLDATAFNKPEPFACPGCSSRLQGQIFPALFRPKATVSAGDLVMQDGEASCFFHPQKRASTPCDSCGRFVCALCDVELKGQHLCPDCLEKGIRKKKLRDLDNRRPLYDTQALQLAVFPLLIFPVTMVTAPLAIYMVIRYWKEPLSILRRSRWRFVVAGLVALAEIVFWVMLFVPAGVQIVGLD